ncbi:MAG: exodeoxyribonuclease III [Nitrospinae bacterium]|nr:exodeoxyribonuclease III [Nitrospinota bacterium]
MRIISWNVNGFRAILRKGFHEWLEQASPDVLCLQETKVCREQLDEIHADPDGYAAVWNSAEKKGYSGVTTWSRKKPKAVHLGLGIDRFDREGRVIRHEYPQFDLLNVYFPSGTSGPERVRFKLEFYDAFLEHCENLRERGKKLVVCGDVNTAHKTIDLKNPKANEKNSGFLPIERAWIDKFIAQGYVDIFRKFHPEPGQYTWWTYRSNAREKNIGWRIDYFFVTEDLAGKVKDAFIQSEIAGSDHCPIGLDIG